MRPNQALVDAGFEPEFCCPFCGDAVDQDVSFCCGEVGHGEWMYVKDDELHTESEAEQKCGGTNVSR